MNETFVLFGTIVEILVDGPVMQVPQDLVKVTDNGGGDPPPHVHKDQAEIFFNHGPGDYWITIGEERTLVKKGDFRVVPPQTVHGFEKAGDEPHEMVISIAPPGLASLLRELAERFPSASDFNPEEFKRISEKHGQFMP